MFSTASAQGPPHYPWMQSLSSTPDSSFARTVNLCRRPGTWTGVSRYKACYFPVDEASSKTKADVSDNRMRDDGVNNLYPRCNLHFPLARR